MKISVVISSLGKGGAERVLSSMTNWWADNGHHVNVVVLGDSSVSAYPIAKDVTVSALGVTGSSNGFFDALANNIRRVRVLKKQLLADSPDLVIGFMDTTNVLTALAAPRNTRVILTEHMPPMMGLGHLWKTLRLFAYFLADKVVVQTEEARAYYPKALRGRISVLPNPVEFPEVASGERKSVLISMGRLAPEKRFDLLIRLFAKILPDNPDWELVILGEGSERAELEALCSDLGVADSVQLPGWEPQPETKLREAGVYAMTSEFEGFCNALVEGMGMGLPAVAFDCPVGPRTIIRHEEDGFLIPEENEEGMLHALNQLMADKTLRETMGQNALRVRERFGVDSVMASWGKLLG